MKIIKQQNFIRWTARILSLLVLVFGLPFYFGYGNPMPFIDTSYTFWDNFWLSYFPVMFISLALGWRFEKIAGFLLTVPLLLGLLLGLIFHGELILHMILPLFIGVLYLLSSKSCKNFPKE